MIGAGATGLPAAIVAREAGCSVILVEAEPDIGGHAIISGGNVPLGGGTSVQKQVRHRGFAGPPVPRPDRLVGGRSQRLSRLPLQRPRDHPRLCRQQRRDLRMAARARRRIRRQGARCDRWQFGRQFGAARDAQHRRSLADAGDRPPGRPGGAKDPLVRQRHDALARDRGPPVRRRDPARAPHDPDLSPNAECGPGARHRGRPQERRSDRHSRPQGCHHRHRRLDRQRQLPPHVRSATDRGVLRPCRHAVVRPGCQR